MKYADRQHNHKVNLEQAINKSDLSGHLAIDIKKDISHYTEDIKFFGVEKKGSMASGRGVCASKIIEKEDKTRLLFSISKLIKKSQFSDDTKEIIIKADSREISRKEIADFPCPYS